MLWLTYSFDELRRRRSDSKSEFIYSLSSILSSVLGNYLTLDVQDAVCTCLTLSKESHFLWWIYQCSISRSQYGSLSVINRGERKKTPWPSNGCEYFQQQHDQSPRSRLIPKASVDSKTHRRSSGQDSTTWLSSTNKESQTRSSGSIVQHRFYPRRPARYYHGSNLDYRPYRIIAVFLAGARRVGLPRVVRELPARYMK